jgi:hypothetical protein
MHRSSRRTHAPAAALGALATALSLGACDLAPPRDQQSDAAREAREATQLRDATRREDLRDRAAEAGQPVEDHDKRQADAIEDAGG